MAEKVAVIDKVKLSLVSWFDNNNGNLLSAYVGSEPTTTKRRLFDRIKNMLTYLLPMLILGTPTSSRGGTPMPDSPVPAKRARQTPARHHDMPLDSVRSDTIGHYPIWKKNARQLCLYGVNWRSRHNLLPSGTGSGDRAVSEALSKLLLKYQGVNSDAGDGTMRALASAAKLVPYDSALFVVTDRGAADPQRLPLALRVLVEKRLKVYTIWTDPHHPSADSETALHELRNVSTHTEGDVLPYSLQVMDMDSSNLASEAELQEWEPLEHVQTRRGRLNPEVEQEKFEKLTSRNFQTLLVRRGGGEAISLGVPVENGVTALKIFIEGAVEHAVLYPPDDGPQIDLYSKASVEAFSPSSRTIGLNPRDVLLVFPGANTTDTLSVVPASSPPADSGMVGVWHLSIRCDTCDYRLGISARAKLHFRIEDEQPDKLRFRTTGPVSSIWESALIDEYGTELAKLSYSYPPMARDTDGAGEDQNKELVANIQLPDVKGSRVYAKIAGRDVKGDPFVRLAGPLRHQSEMRAGRSAAIAFPETDNDLELVEMSNSRLYSERLQYNDTNVLPYNRAVSQVVNQRGALLTAVQIGLSTRLYGAPGDSLQLHFEVTNFREQTINFRYGAVGEQRFLTGINPTRSNIPSGRTENIIVGVTISNSAQPGARDFITFTAYGLEQVSISAYVYVINPGQTMEDVWAPEVRHNFQGSCIGNTGEDCAHHVWAATIIARDAVSGNLTVRHSVSGNLTVRDAVSGNLTVRDAVSGNLTARDAVSGNLTVRDAVSGNLTVTARDELSDNLTVRDAVSGNLTVRDAVSGNLTVRDAVSGNLTVRDAVSGNLTVRDSVSDYLTVRNSVSGNLTVRDAVSGLLRLSSSPVGLTYDSNFVSGSREEVVATYRATCCAPRLVVTAVDAMGNANSHVVDISGYITGAGIAAIVLGVVLAIGLIALIVFLIAFCVRRRRESRELPYSTSSRNIS
ncbi:unnamed protein product [Diatraea saccharalis]|uniref:Uncharacterized protein n=1 Tax=Diatraea saccharalis TaxID=40085 RepID=A0A9N9R6M4_9NEOP|nr:unnamed protein product [Diatraea saccharalis]